MPRVQHCTLCRNHKAKVLKKGHEPCPFSKCECNLCDLSQRSRRVMCHQQRLWRFKKDKISKLKKAGKIIEEEVNDGSGTKTQFCDRCRNHNLERKKKKHSCPFANCNCKFCRLNYVRRTQMMHQQKVRRSDGRWNAEKDSFEPDILGRTPPQDCNNPKDETSNVSLEDSKELSRDRVPSPLSEPLELKKDAPRECINISDRFNLEESRSRLIPFEKAQKENCFDNRKLHLLKHSSPFGGIIELFESKFDVKDEIKAESHHRQILDFNQKSAFSSVKSKKPSLQLDSLRMVNCPLTMVPFEDRVSSHFGPKDTLQFNGLSLPANIIANSLRLPVPPPTIIHHPRPLLAYSSYSHQWAHMMLPAAANYNFDVASRPWFDAQDFWSKPPNY